MAATKNTSTKKKSTSKGRQTGKKTGKGTTARTGSRTAAAKTRTGSTASGGNSRGPRKTFDPEEFQLFREAWIWFALAFCLLILISYFGIGGYLGSIVSDVSFGCFGTAAWALPFLLFATIVFVLKGNADGSFSVGRMAAGLVLALCICGILELAMNGYQVGVNLFDLYQESAVTRSGGGAVGAALCGVLCPAIGAAGTMVVFLVFAIIAIVLLTRKSLFKSMQDHGRTAVTSARENRQRKQQIRQERMEWEAQQARERQNRKREQFRQRRQELTIETPSGTDRDGQLFMAEYTTPVRSREPERVPEIPVIAGKHTGERRKHRASGSAGPITMTAETRQPVNEMQQLVPSRGPAPRKKKPVVTSFPARQDPPAFIDLDHAQKDTSAESHTTSAPDAPRVEAFQKQLNLHLGEEASDGESAGQNEKMSAGPEMTGETQAKETERAVDNAGSGKITSRRTRQILTGEEADAAESSLAENLAAGKAAADEEATAAARPAEGEKPTADAQDGTAARSPKKNPRSSQEEIEAGISSVADEMSQQAEMPKKEYIFPPFDLMKRGKTTNSKSFEQEMRSTAEKLQNTLDSFGVHATVTDVTRGPSVTRFELQPEQGVKVSRIVSLSDDIKLNLAAADIRIEAPIPGKAAVGIEVPNAENSAVMLRDLLESDEFQKHPSRMAFATGKDIGGRVIVSDLAKMPHLLIAGATGSGKSVCINTIVMSILYKAKPEEVRLIMIDPKVVELSVYNGIPHLLIPVVTDPKKAAGALNWGVAEMMDRYNKFAQMGVRDIKGYNQKVDSIADIEDDNKPEKLPQILIIVDELADLMMVAPGEVEDAICRLAQLARAAGIHLVIATQRPSVNVITGVIKANMPSRIAFQVSSGVDSRTILDMVGAEKLLGKGDMLFYPSNYPKPARIQGAFVSDEEVSDVVDFLKNENNSSGYSAKMQEQMDKIQSAVASARGAEDTDALFAEAGKFIIEKDKASIGMLQRVFKIGFNRAARIMDQLSDAGVVGPEEGTKPRKILMSEEQFENYLETHG